MSQLFFFSVVCGMPMVFCDSVDILFTFRGGASGGVVVVQKKRSSAYSIKCISRITAATTDMQVHPMF